MPSEKYAVMVKFLFIETVVDGGTRGAGMSLTRSRASPASK
jgi:hypothetical protein